MVVVVVSLCWGPAVPKDSRVSRDCHLWTQNLDCFFDCPPVSSQDSERRVPRTPVVVCEGPLESYVKHPYSFYFSVAFYREVLKGRHFKTPVLTSTWSFDRHSTTFTSTDVLTVWPVTGPERDCL